MCIRNAVINFAALRSLGKIIIMQKNIKKTLSVVLKIIYRVKAWIFVLVKMKISIRD